LSLAVKTAATPIKSAFADSEPVLTCDGGFVVEREVIVELSSALWFLRDLLLLKGI